MDDLDNQMRIMALEAERILSWKPLATYYHTRLKGLRRQALADLAPFAEEVEHWEFPERLKLIRWLFDAPAPGSRYAAIFPHPLYRLAHPTFQEWTQRCPDDPIAHRYLGMFLVANTPCLPSEGELELRRAIELDPDEQPARIEMVERIIYTMWSAAHNLPFNYFGDPFEKLAYADEGDRLASEIKDEAMRQRLKEAIHKERERVLDWQASRRRNRRR